MSVVVFIGLILLVGIVVKNAIVLIDKVNQLREEGVAKREAICRGAESRLRPIIMTTLTTLFGFAAAGACLGGDGAEVRAPMAITVIGGLSVSTLLTLIVIPVVYNLLDRRTDASTTVSAPQAAGRGPWHRRAEGAQRMTLAELSLRRPVTTVMFFVSMVVIGLIAAFRLPLEQFPEINAPFVMVQPAVRRLDAAGSRAQRHRGRSRKRWPPCPGIKRMNSTSRADGAGIFIEFSDWDRDIAITASEARERIDAIRSELAGRPAALFRAEVLADRPADDPRCGLPSNRDLPDRIRPDRARSSSAGSSASRAWPASRFPARRPTRSRSPSIPTGSARTTSASTSWPRSCRRSISRSPPADQRGQAAPARAAGRRDQGPGRAARPRAQRHRPDACPTSPTCASSCSAGLRPPPRWPARGRPGHLRGATPTW